MASEKIIHQELAAHDIFEIIIPRPTSERQAGRSQRVRLR